MELRNEEVLKMNDEAPDYCPITGLSKCNSYLIDDNVVYLTNPAYTAYTLPEYDESEQSFYRTKYDLDEDIEVGCEFLCELDDLIDRDDFEYIKEFYNIKY